MWKEPQLESRRWVRCQSRAFFASAAVFSFLPVARGWFPGSGSSPASDFPMPGGPFTWTELGLEPRDRIRRREHLAFTFTFSATFEICRRRPDLSAGKCRKCGRERNSLIRTEISLIARFNSLQGSKKFPVRMRRELARKTLI